MHDLTVWTCKLRPNVKFQNGADFERGRRDHLVRGAVGRSSSPLHIGATGDFEYWASLIGSGFLNPAGPCGLSNTPACPAGNARSP